MLRLSPDLADVLHGELALRAPRRVRALLELVHGRLAEHGRDGALDVLGQQRQAARPVGGRVEELLEDERLAEHAGRLGEGQRRVLLERAPALRQRGVQPVAELVGERQHVAALARVVEQHVRVHARHGVGAERAAALGRAHRRVDPALVEEAPGGVAQHGGEGVEGAQHDVASVVPADLLVDLRDAGGAVVVGELVEAEELRLQLVPALRQLVGALDRLDERLDGLVAGLIGQVAARQPAGVAAQAVVDGLVEQQRVEDVAPGAQAGLQRDGDGLLGRAAHFAIRRGEVRQRDVERDRALGQLDLDGAGQLGEQPAPGRVAGLALLGEDALLGLGEQVRAIAADGAQVVARLLEAVGLQQLVGLGVVDLGPLEVEEQQVGLDRRPALLDLGHQRAVDRIGGVGGEAQRRVVARAADRVGDRGELGDGAGEPGAVELGHLAGVGDVERR